MRRVLPFAALAALLFLAPAPGGSVSGAVPPPSPQNIVLILTDDQRWDAMNHMPYTNSVLTAHGVKFTNAFVVNPLCCPSRASILTGEYSHSTHVYSNSPTGGFGSFDDRSTVATWLHAAGYRTALIGKYLNGYCAAQTAYIPPGWDRWVAYTTDCGQGTYFNYTVSSNGTPLSYGSTAAAYSTDVFAADAAAFIRGTPAGTPLFLYFAPKAPHYPAVPAPRDATAFSGMPPRRPPSYNEADVSDKPAWVRGLPLITPADEASNDAFRVNQYRSLLGVDDAVRTIVSALSATGRLRNTMIVFMSDNGIEWGEHRWRGKNVPYDESVRVPMVVRDDRLGIPPRTDSHLVLNVDLARTFADAAHTEAPGAEGLDLLPLLRAPALPWRTDFLIEHKQEGNVVTSFCAVRSGRYAYVEYATGEEELYDLHADPFELRNVAASPAYAAVLANRRARVHALCSPPPPGMTVRH
jgi:N-acetylglucosamine-6-sulfatase